MATELIEPQAETNNDPPVEPPPVQTPEERAKQIQLEKILASMNTVVSSLDNDLMRTFGLFRRIQSGNLLAVATPELCAKYGTTVETLTAAAQKIAEIEPVIRESQAIFDGLI